MKKTATPLLTLIFLLSGLVIHAQCLMNPVSLQQRVQQSQIVVEGKVISQKSFWDDTHSMIYTMNEVEVYKVFKGKSVAMKVAFITEGGQVDNEMIVAEPGVRLLVGEAGLFLLSNNHYATSNAPGGAVNYELYSAQQGYVKYDLTDQTAHDPFNNYNNIAKDLYKPVLTYSGNSSFTELKGVDFFNVHNGEPLTPPVISSFSPTTADAGTQDANLFTITGSNFGDTYVSGTSKIEFRNANDGGATYVVTPDNHIQSWSSTSITTWIPTGAGSGKIRVTNSSGEATIASTSLTINYNESNVVSGGNYYLPDLVSDNGSGGYTFVYNTTFNSNTSAVAAFERALSTWRCGTLVNIDRSGTTTIGNNASDGTNVVTFDGVTALATGVLGTCYSYYSSCATGVWYLTELDLKLKTNGTDGITWNYGPGATTGSNYDFESVCVHELGHGQQLGHTNLTPPSVMHYAISNAADRRTLNSSSEVDGGNDIMTRSAVNNSCGPTKMIAISAGSCTLSSGTAPVADFTASTTSLCQNKTVNYTDLSTNSPTSWSWTFTGGTPSTSTLKNPTAIKYKTAGTFAVTLVASNGSGSDTETKTGYITVNPLPVVTLSAGACSAGKVIITCASDISTGVKYKWMKDGVTITGAKSATYSATASGSYKCTVTVNASSCKTTSSPLSVTISCKEGEEQLPVDVDVYPNPSANFFAFNTSTLNSDGEVDIHDITGKLLEVHYFSSGNVNVGRDFPAGVYLAVIKQNGEVVKVVKLVKD